MFHFVCVVLLGIVKYLVLACLQRASTSIHCYCFICLYTPLYRDSLGKLIVKFDHKGPYYPWLNKNIYFIVKI